MRRIALFASILFLICSSAQAQDDSMTPEPQVPGEVQIVRWDMLLNQHGADAVNSVAKPAKSDSKMYQDMTASAFELRQAMADANTNQGVEDSGQLVFAQSIGGSLNMQQPYFNLSPNQNSQVGLNGGLQGTQALTRPAADHAHISLGLTSGYLQFREQNRFSTASRNTSPEIHYDGDLAPGDAVAFLAPLTFPSKTVYYHLMVYEAFKAYPAMMPWIQAVQGSTWWCNNGPSVARKWAGTALVWESHADHDRDGVPTDFIQKLSDGKELCLVGLSRPSVAPFCWWDAQGKPIVLRQPVGINYDGTPVPGLEVYVELRGSSKDIRLDSPATQPINPPNTPEDQPYLQTGFQPIADNAAELKVGAAVGPWKEAGQLKAGETTEIDGIKYQVNEAQKQGDNALFINYQQAGSGESVYAVTAVGPDGKEAVNIYNNVAAVDFAQPGNNPPSFNQWISCFFQGIAAGDLQYLRLSKRARQYITFKNFAVQPQTPVNTAFTPQDLEAGLKSAQDRLEKQQHEQAMEVVKAHDAKRKKWDEIPADPNTPMGALRLFIEAGDKGDEKAVRALLTSASADAGPNLDAAAHALTLIQTNWKRAADRFGEDKILQIQNGMLDDYAIQLADTTWKKNDDGSMEGDEFIVRKDDSGQFKLDLGKQMADKDFLTQLNLMLIGQEKIAKVLDQKDSTFEQLVAAAQSGGQ